MPRHRHEWSFQAHVIMELPASAFHRVNKTVLRSRKVRLMGVSWDGVTIAYCKTCDKATKDLTVLCNTPGSSRRRR